MKEQKSFFRMNQEGYATGLPVHAAVLTAQPVLLKDAEGNILRTVDSAPLQADPSSGDEVRLISLGILDKGVYTLETSSEKRSLPVHPDAWRNVTNALIKGLYYQRCGCGLLPAHAGAYCHSPCHTGLAVDWNDRSIRRSVTGGWHDAGDYGKYVGPGAVTVAHLLYAWKLFPSGCSDELNIPETGNGVPDILNEARYELEWMLKMQESDGSFHHKLTKSHFAAFIMPQDDLETEYLLPPSHCATAAACACMALACRVYRGFSEAFANQMLLSAKKAWSWLQSHPDFVPYMNPEGVRTGWYGDRSDTDERFWAACELYAATGEAPYREAAEAIYEQHVNLTGFGWADVGGLGALCCLFDLKESAGDVLYTRLRHDFLCQSEKALELSAASGYGTSLSPDGYIWGSILPIMSHAMTMIINTLLTGRQDMKEAALLQWDYALGLNALDTCFVTGFGQKPILHPHHRPSEADGIEAPVPGLISGGPNKLHNSPFTREKVGEDTPPAKFFLDETPSADTNEIAIYWNSPAVFTGAFFSMLSRA